MAPLTLLALWLAGPGAAAVQPCAAAAEQAGWARDIYATVEWLGAGSTVGRGLAVEVSAAASQQMLVIAMSVWGGVLLLAGGFYARRRFGMCEGGPQQQCRPCCVRHPTTASPTPLPPQLLQHSRRGGLPPEGEGTSAAAGKYATGEPTAAAHAAAAQLCELDDTLASELAAVEDAQAGRGGQHETGGGRGGAVLPHDAASTMHDDTQ